MKTYRSVKVGLIAVTLALLGACSSTPYVQPDRYTFDQLTEVKSINNYQLSGWESIDQQSFFINTSPSKYYLLVLRRKDPSLKFREGLAISSTAGSVTARFDTVSTRDGVRKNTIAHIYKLNKADKQQVRQQILGNPLTDQG